MRRRLRWLIPVGLVLQAAAALYLLARPRERPVRASLSVAEALAGDTTGFARAYAPRPFSFPADHGPHPEFRAEWWYFTGHLEAADGRRFGYQLTFFRSALSPEPAPRESAWGANQVYMAHFAVTDVAGGAFYSFDRFGREALGLAGAGAAPLRVWLEEWGSPGSSRGASGGSSRRRRRMA